MQPTESLPTTTIVPPSLPSAAPSPSAPAPYRVVLRTDPSKPPIYLTPWTNEDTPTLVSLINSAHADVDFRDNLLSFPIPFTHADAASYIAKRQLASQSALGSQYFAIRLGSPRAPIVGGFGWSAGKITSDVVTPLGTCPYVEWVMGAWVVQAERGTGIVPDCIAETKNWAAQDPRVARVVGQLFVENRASLRVVEKNGFVMEGVIRGAVVKEGKLRDIYQLAWSPPGARNGKSALQARL